MVGEVDRGRLLSGEIGYMKGTVLGQKQTVATGCFLTFRFAAFKSEHPTSGAEVPTVSACP